MNTLGHHLGDRLRGSVLQFRLGRDAHLSGWVIRSGDDLTRFSLFRAGALSTTEER